jgi:DNA-binding transcriptional ArsR family regulator
LPKQSAAPEALFCALGDPTRLAVVSRLCRKPETVTSLAAPFKMALPSFMQHLQVLEDSGWIQSKKEGRVRTCEINPEALGRAGLWLSRQRGLWEARMDRMDAYLLQLKSEEKPR